MGGGASKYSADAAVGKDPAMDRPLLPPPPMDEDIRPHGKRLVIKKGCDCSWCEAVSWELVGELRESCEKLQQSLMMREVDKAELEALLQIKIEVSTDLRQKLKQTTEDGVDLRKQIHEQQEKIAMHELRQELHEMPAEMTQLQVEELLQWKATASSALADATSDGAVPSVDVPYRLSFESRVALKNMLAGRAIGGTPLDDARLIVDKLKNYETAMQLADEVSSMPCGGGAGSI